MGAEPAVQEKVARALAKADASPGTQRFQLLLLSATLKAGGLEVVLVGEPRHADSTGFGGFRGAREIGMRG